MNTRNDARRLNLLPARPFAYPQAHLAQASTIPAQSASHRLSDRLRQRTPREIWAMLPERAIFAATTNLWRSRLVHPPPHSTAVNGFRIRTMRLDEISLAVHWAADEGWNPGLADAACFAEVDAEGFLVGELDGAPAATISCVNYDASFAFLGFYIVRKDLRGRGFGLRIWNAAIAHAGPRVIGLDGVVGQQQNYRKSGFKFAYSNVRYGGVAAAGPTPPAGVVPLAEVPLPTVAAYDTTVFPALRTAFLRAWIGSPGHSGCALIRDGSLAGWGVIRPCRQGWKIGPLAADDHAAAEAILLALLTSCAGGEIFLDVPSINRDAIALAQDLGLAPVFETARMYTGAIKPLRLERIFGVTTFELG